MEMERCDRRRVWGGGGKANEYGEIRKENTAKHTKNVALVWSRERRNGRSKDADERGGGGIISHSLAA